MLEEREIARRIVETGLLGPDAFAAAELPPVPARYELVHKVGEGGGGTVWLATDTHLKRPVALKYLTDATQADLERFRREARFTARLNDPAIVQVYEMGDVEGSAYIAMQYIDGSNLREAELSLEELVRVLRTVAVALHHAHRVGIVHRDIKPENILLDSNGNAYLTDFGIARDLSGTLGETMSREGQIMGTPALMPPEQARGEPQLVDARSDVYALGGTLYYKMTGRYPFEGDNVVEVLHAVINDQPRLPRSLDASLPRTLEAIAVKCLQKNKEERYQTAEEIVADFDRFLDGAEASAENNAWFRRLVGHLDSAPPEPEPAEPREDRSWAQGMEIVRELSAWDANLYRVTGSLVRAFERLDAIRERLEAILDERPDIAWARFYRGVALFRRGRLAEAREDMECGIDRVKDLAGAYFELGRLYLTLYLDEQHTARKHLTPSGTENSLAEARVRIEQANLAFQEARHLNGELLPWHVDYARAVACLAESDYCGCIGVCDEILADEPDLEEVWKLRGDAQHLADGEPFSSYARAVDIRRSYFEAFFAIAEAHLARGQVAAARVALERAVEIHPEFAEARAILARTYLPEDEDRTDEDQLKRGRELAREAFALDSSSYEAAVTLARFQLEVGRRLGDNGSLDEALGTLGAATDLDGCQNRVSLLTAMTKLELGLSARKRGADSRPYLDEVLDLCQESSRVTNSPHWKALRSRAETELALPS
ncbi:MAG: protein kinase [Planctomycetota bacterium]|nr:protein kinase [Planctomycetota bacterium]